MLGFAESEGIVTGPVETVGVGAGAGDGDAGGAEAPPPDAGGGVTTGVGVGVGVTAAPPPPPGLLAFCVGINDTEEVAADSPPVAFTALTLK